VILLRKPDDGRDFERTLLVRVIAEKMATAHHKRRMWGALYWLRCWWQRPADAANGALRDCGLPEVRL
jgi:hypothetical protein